MSVAAAEADDVAAAVANYDVVALAADEGLGRGGPDQAIVVIGALTTPGRFELRQRKAGAIVEQDAVDRIAGCTVRIGVAQRDPVAAVTKEYFGL